jgi:hypothetical protein
MESKREQGVTTEEGPTIISKDFPTIRGMKESQRKVSPAQKHTNRLNYTIFLTKTTTLSYINPI